MRSLVFSSLCVAFISVPVTLSLPLQSSYVLSSARRDLLGILGDIDGGTPLPSTTELANTSPEGSPSFSLLAFSKAGITISGASYPMTTASSFALRSTNSFGITTHPPGSNEPITVDSVSSKTSHATSTASVSPYTIGDISDASATPPAELTEWKVIGIAVITITFIGTAILAVSFFDSWWGFVRAAVCGQPRRGTRGLAGETLVPDWEKRSWEFKLANEDGHRYPTLASLDSIFKEKERAEGLAREGPGYTSSPLEAPEMAYGGI